MTVIALIKLAASIMIPTGVASVAKAMTKTAIQTLSKPEKICAIVATSAVGTMVADKATEHFCGQMDAIQAKLNAAKAEKEAKPDGGHEQPAGE